MADSRSTFRSEPVPKDEQLFAWLERLFHGEGEFPSQIQIWRAKGQNIRGVNVKQVLFTPEERKKAKSEKVDEEVEAAVDAVAPSIGTPKGRPSREWLVAFANEIVFRCQHDCDAECKEHKYNVLAMQFGRLDDFYDRWPMRFFPKHRKKQEDADSDDDDEGGGSPRTALLKQSLEHNEHLANLYGGAIESVVETLQAQNQSLRAENEALRAKLSNQYEMIEKLQSNQAERDRAARWDEAKLKHTDRVIEQAFMYLPALLPGVAATTTANGKPKDTPDSLALKEFFKEPSEGGRLTQQQVQAAFGLYGANKELLQPGILNPSQVQILVDVATLSTTADDLDRLLPGGDQTVTMEQVARLQQVFSQEQIVPILLLLNARLQRKQTTSQNGQGASA